MNQINRNGLNLISKYDETLLKENKDEINSKSNIYESRPKEEVKKEHKKGLKKSLVIWMMKS